jgi:hypothetical protein
LRSTGRPGYPSLLVDEQVLVLTGELDRGALAHAHERDRWMLKWVNDLIDELFGVRYGDDAGLWRSCAVSATPITARDAGRCSATSRRSPGGAK